MLSDEDYQVLANFRFALRHFAAFSEAQAAAAGLTAQQHQALLAIRGAGSGEVTIGQVAARLALKPHTASELIERMAAAGLVARVKSPIDRRRSMLTVTERGSSLLEKLSATHRQELLQMRPLLIDLLGALG